MYSNKAVIVGASRTTKGAASLIQGVYGALGNLELLTCDVSEGLWVFWFNSDSRMGSSPTADVKPGDWSTGLHFAAGSTYSDAVVLQGTFGPHHLEILALDADGIVQSWFWSPSKAFQRRETDAAAGAAAFTAEHADGTVTVTVTARDGEYYAVSSNGSRYPYRTWKRQIPRSAPSAGSALEAVVATGVPLSSIATGTVRATRSNRKGGTAELTWRGTDGLLRHLGVRDDSGLTTR